MGTNAQFIFSATREQLRRILALSGCKWDPIFRSPAFEKIEPVDGETCWQADLIIRYVPSDAINGQVVMYLTAPRYSTLEEAGFSHCRNLIRSLIGYNPPVIEVRPDSAQPDYSTSVKSLGFTIIADQWRSLGKPFAVSDAFTSTEHSDDLFDAVAALWQLVYNLLRAQDPTASDEALKIRALSFPGLENLEPSVVGRLADSSPLDDGALHRLSALATNASLTACFFCKWPDTRTLVTMGQSTVPVCSDCESGHCGECNDRNSKMDMRYHGQRGYFICANCE
jgi:hypothetical protein